MTWKELQETCLRKMFSLDEVDLVQDSTTKPYINSMPAAATEAMNILATAGRYFKKCITIDQDWDASGGELLGGMVAYDLRQLADDFYCIDQVTLINGENYGSFHGYRLEGDHIFLVPASTTGTFRVWYNAYPPKITKNTAADFVIDLHPEELSMVALYMAGQLYKDDDISIATGYMNEFSVWLEELKESSRKAAGRNGSSGGFTSSKGWY